MGQLSSPVDSVSASPVSVKRYFISRSKFKGKQPVRNTSKNV